MSSVHLSDAQIALRQACQTGDLAALKAALSPQSRRPSLARSLWHWLRGRQEDFESLPASLAYVYEDDQCNLPIHYLATGAPVSRSASSHRHLYPRNASCQNRVVMPQRAAFRPGVLAALKANQTDWQLRSAESFHCILADNARFCVRPASCQLQVGNRAPLCHTLKQPSHFSGLYAPQ